MSNIGGLVFTAMRGTLQGPRPDAQVFRRAGVAGHGVVVSAPHGVEQELQTILISSPAACIAYLGAGEALVGTVVSVTDADGTTFANCTILDVRGATQAITGAGGNTCLMTQIWRLVAES